MAVYEPYLQKDKPKIKTVKELAPNIWLITDEEWQASVRLKDVKLDVDIKNTVINATVINTPMTNKYGSC